MIRDAGMNAMTAGRRCAHPCLDSMEERRMGRVIVFILVGALVAGLIARRLLRNHRRKHATSELNQHPERLDQMLDPTDDA
jgi:hypothetical protein